MVHIRQDRGVNGSVDGVNRRLRRYVDKQGGNSEQMEELYTLRCSGTELEGGGELPKVVKLLPWGEVRSQKGDFQVDQESFRAMKQEFDSRGLDLVIDYEHQTLDGVQAPAAGWIKELVPLKDSIGAKVEWTKRAAGYLRGREYRYLSPVVLVRKADHKAVCLHSAALTNTPAIDGMFAVVNKADLNGKREGGTGMDEQLLKQLAALLGLAEGATAQEILAAFQAKMEEAKAAKAGTGREKAGEEAGKTAKGPEGEGTKTDGAGAEGDGEEEKVVANKAICSLLGLKGGAATSDALAAIMALKNTGDRVLSTRVRELEAKLAKKEADEVVSLALKAGKIAPTQKEWATAYVLKDPAGFSDFAAKAPQVVPLDEINFGTEVKALSSRTDARSREEQAVFSLLGISDDDYKKYGGR